MSKDKMRGQFEAWYEAWQMPSESGWFVLEDDGDYYLPHTDTAWNAWRAALSQSEQVLNMVWIPVSERLPEKRERCLCLTEDGDIEVRKFCLHKFAGAHTRQVTHWMPLPAAPKEVE